MEAFGNFHGNISDSVRYQIVFIHAFLVSFQTDLKFSKMYKLRHFNFWGAVLWAGLYGVLISDYPKIGQIDLDDKNLSLK